MVRVADRGNAEEMAKQPFYRFVASTYVWHIVASAVALYAIGGLPGFLWGFCFRTAWRAPTCPPSPASGELGQRKQTIGAATCTRQLAQPRVRELLQTVELYSSKLCVVTHAPRPSGRVWHITWFVNSASHVWGTQPFRTGDLSRNNWWVGILAFGEGWHNNHHAFEFSARHGLEWWQVDMTWRGPSRPALPPADRLSSPVCHRLRRPHAWAATALDIPMGQAQLCAEALRRQSRRHAVCAQVRGARAAGGWPGQQGEAAQGGADAPPARDAWPSIGGAWGAVAAPTATGVPAGGRAGGGCAAEESGVLRAASLFA